MKLTTNLVLLRRHNACEDRYAHLVAALGPKWGGAKPIPFLQILKINGLDDALWALRAVPQKQTAARDRIARLFAADCAAHVLRLFEAESPTDTRPRECIVVARRFVNGKATANLTTHDAAARGELAAASDAAASSFVAASAAAAASDAAAAAFHAAAAAAAAAASTYAAERKWQENRLVRYLRDGPLPRPMPLPRRAR